MYKHIFVIGAFVALLVPGVFAQTFTSDFELIDQVIGTNGFSRAIGYDPVSGQILLPSQGDVAVYIRDNTAGAAGTPATINTTGISLTDRNLPFFGIGVSDSGVIYSYVNDTNDDGTPGDGIIRWASISSAPVEIATLNAADSALFQARNLEVVESGGTDYLIEAGIADVGSINIWSWDGATFQLEGEIGGTAATPGGKSGQDIDAWPPSWALGADSADPANDGAHLWSNATGNPGSANWTFEGNLTPPASVNNVDTVSPCMDVAFDVNVSGLDEPVMFALWAPDATADTVTLAMYELGSLGSPIAQYDIATGGANPNALGGGLAIDEANNVAYFGWRNSTAGNFSYGRISYTPPQAAPPAAVNYQIFTIESVFSEAELQAIAGTDTGAGEGTEGIEGITFDATESTLYIDFEESPSFTDILLSTDPDAGTGSVAIASLDVLDTDTSDFRISGGFAMSGGNIYAGDFNTSGTNTMSMWEINPTGGTMTELTQTGDLSGNNDYEELAPGTMLVVREDSFGGDETLRTVNLSTGVVSAPLITLTGTEPLSIAVVSSDEAYVGTDVSDQIVQVTGLQGTPASAEATPSTWTGDLNVYNLHVASDGTLIASDEGDADAIRVWTGDAGTSIDIPFATIASALGGTSFSPARGRGFAVRENPAESEVELFLANFDGADGIGIVKITFGGTTTPVAGYELYR